MKQLYHEGDLCILEGYGNRVWEVLGWTLEKTYMAGKYSEEIVYNLICVHSSDWSIGVQKELKLVCKANYAYQYLKELDKNGSPPDIETYMSIESIQEILREIESIEEVEIMNMKRVRDLNKPYKYSDDIDGLLDRLYDIKFIEDQSGELSEDLTIELELVKTELEELREKGEEK